MQALGGMMVKHTTSVYDMIASGKEYPLSLWNEKITDHINYLLLLKTTVVASLEKTNIPAQEHAVSCSSTEVGVVNETNIRGRFRKD